MTNCMEKIIEKFGECRKVAGVTINTTNLATYTH